jgi:hypothetical protein
LFMLLVAARLLLLGVAHTMPLLGRVCACEVAGSGGIIQWSGDPCHCSAVGSVETLLLGG